MAFTPGSRQAVALGTAWALLAVCTGAGVAFFSEIRAAADSVVGRQDAAIATVPGDRERLAPLVGARTVELRAGAYGHFHVRADINGSHVQAMVDTGASMVALRFEDARDAGIIVSDADFTHRVSTANGYARMAPVTIERISIGDITVRDVTGAVLEPGKLSTTLLGMSFLTRLQRVDMRSGTLVLQE
jgi:aspartyl protease family protein